MDEYSYNYNENFHLKTISQNNSYIQLYLLIKYKNYCVVNVLKIDY